ncbi:DNA binding domain-containing protein, excisionase family [Arthrobacter subterraneus]|uniref:DNA binding domain-containing protein, excisionase family n=2 Tax=Arthrobacter subterraneus TaxID=335973 RepID=A0A1G8MRA3_9MICC|nr:DNA binding domain-containing protein, excisionase family [Arthrobacter subterraneus]
MASMEGDQLVGVLEERFAEYPEHLTLEHLAEILGVKRPTAYQWVRNGVIPAYKVGGAWIIYRDEVLEHLRQSRNIPAPPDPDTHTE